MSLIVEDGTGKTTAESPNSIAEIDAYATSKGTPRLAAAWTALTTSAKENAARRASDKLERGYGHRVRGYRKAFNQALSWPRFAALNSPLGQGYTVVDGMFSDALVISADIVPQQWKDAHCELALRAGAGTDLEPDLKRGGMLTSMTMGAQGGAKTSVSESWSPGAPAGEQWPIVDDILSRLLKPAGYLVRA